MNGLLARKPSFSLSSFLMAPSVKLQQQLKKRSQTVSNLLKLYSSQMTLLSHQTISATATQQPFANNNQIKQYYQDLTDSYAKSFNALNELSSNSNMQSIPEFKFSNYIKDELYTRSEELSKISMKLKPNDLKWLNENYSPIIHSFLSTYHRNRLQSTYELANYLNTSRTSPLVQVLSARYVVEKAIKFTNDVLALNNYPSPTVNLSVEQDINDGQELTIKCIPQHINHVIFELLKNATLPSISRQSVITIIISKAPHSSITKCEQQHQYYHNTELMTGSLIPDSMTRIKISDNAGGLSPSIIPKILQFHFTTAKFASAEDGNYEDDMADQISGFGMGLPLCQVITGFNGGLMEIENRLGEGVDVVVDLPSY